MEGINIEEYFNGVARYTCYSRRTIAGTGVRQGFSKVSPVTDLQGFLSDEFATRPMTTILSKVSSPYYFL